MESANLKNEFGEVTLAEFEIGKKAVVEIELEDDLKKLKQEMLEVKTKIVKRGIYPEIEINPLDMI